VATKKEIEEIISKLGQFNKETFEIEVMLSLWAKGIESERKEVKEVIKELMKKGKLIYIEPKKMYVYVER
jgi:predicted regulator of amino acid metabolism with ACT domain